MTLDCTAVIDLCCALGWSGAKSGAGLPVRAPRRPKREAQVNPKGGRLLARAGVARRSPGDKPRSAPRSYPRTKTRSVTVMQSNVFPL